MNTYAIDKEFPDCFPDDFKDNILPQDARPEELTVYRGCKTGIIDKNTFLSSYEEIIIKGIDTLSPNDKKKYEKNLKKPGFYGTSCFLDLEELKDIMDSAWQRHKDAKILIGTMKCEDGLSQQTINRTAGCMRKSHVDWWLYKNSDPSTYFKEVE